MPAYAFEDFAVGRIVGTGECVVTAEEIAAFANRFDPQPFHIDDDAARSSIYRGLIASGWHTVSMVMRIACDVYLNQSTSAGSPGVDRIRWLRPVRAGDTLRARFEVVEVKPSTSKPDRGTVTIEWKVSNQRDEPVMSLLGMGIFMRRDSSSFT